jgi:predicted alpha-1,2-mannosidase
LLKPTSRRSFLKVTSLSAAAMTAGVIRAEDATQKSSNTGPMKSAGSPVEFVNLLQGTASTPSFSRGNTLPIAARPFGMAHWTLQSNADSPWMFHPGERRIQGFRSTHQLSPWLSDYGHATFLPISGEVEPNARARASSIRPEEATLLPHTMGLHLMRYGIDAELIPTERCCMLTAAYSLPQSPGLIFDIPSVHAEIHEDKNTRTISFSSTANAGGVPENFATYYVLRFNLPWKTFESKQTKASTVGVVRFADHTSSSSVQIGSSFISFDQARLNLDLEIGTKSAQALRDEGKKIWNDHLGRIEIEGATVEQQRTFYSCLYRTLLFPRIWHEPTADGKMQHRSAYNGKVLPGLMYADHGYWDVYRAWYPFMTVLFPERLGEILQSWVNAYNEGGWLPQFPCPGYRACMTGSLIDSVFGDAAVKKIPNFDLATAYAGLRKHATEPGNADAGYGRRGLPEYLKYNFCPADLVHQSAAETVDAAYGDFCIAQVAKALGHEKDYAMFMSRSQNWRQLFDRESGFIRGKNSDGKWLTPFDPVTWGNPYVEGAAWQHRFDVPHDIPALIESLGGPQKTVAALEQMCTMSPSFNVGSYGQEIHEMSEMAAVPFGQYAHSNQPVHHILYLFAHAGRPDRTRFWTQRVMRELYTPDTFSGDEDTGSMAAWYILSALGFYPSCPGKAEYTLGGGLFRRATVHLPNNKTLVVETAGQAEHATFNGQAVNTTISHDALIAGGRLRFS